MTCTHEHFAANVEVNRLQDSGRYTADVRITCMDCGVPMRFIGLPGGLDLNGAAVSADATEARLAIAPKGEVVPPMAPDSIHGFSIRASLSRAFWPVPGDTDPAAFVAAMREVAARYDCEAMDGFRWIGRWFDWLAAEIEKRVKDSPGVPP